MSTDEQDQIFGRLRRENRECDDRIKALRGKLRFFSEKLLDVAIKLLNASKDEAATPAKSAFDSLDDFPDAEIIAAALKDLDANRERSAELSRLLAS